MSPLQNNDRRSAMRQKMKTTAAVVVVGLGVVGAVHFFGGDGRGLDTTDLQAFRTELREGVTRGKMSEAEAQVRLAEAMARARQKERAKDKLDVSPELMALGERLMEQVQKGELTGAEAKAQWRRAVGKAGKKRATGRSEKPQVEEKTP